MKLYLAGVYARNTHSITQINVKPLFAFVNYMFLFELFIDQTFLYLQFQHMADLFNISVRTGCFCNAGSCQRHLRWTNKQMKDMYKSGHRCGDEVDILNGHPTGAIRVSFGFFNTFDDVDRLIQMICHCFIKTIVDKPKRLINYKALQNSKPYKMSNENILLQVISEPDYFTNVNNNLSIPYESSNITLEEMSIFPIKSCGAFKIKTNWIIGPKGFEYDREWMIVKDNGVCLTQKSNTKMCLICPKIYLKHKLMILTCKGSFFYLFIGIKYFSIYTLGAVQDF